MHYHTHTCIMSLDIINQEDTNREEEPHVVDPKAIATCNHDGMFDGRTVTLLYLSFRYNKSG